MTLIPVFEIGLWNAWILMLLIFLYILLSVQIFKDVGKKIAHGEEEKKFSIFIAVFFFILLIYSIFLPLKLWVIWFYTGLAIYLLGLIIITIALVNVAATQLGEPFTKGTYRYSRHPLSLGMSLTFLGTGIASASWLYLLLSVILIVITHFMVVIEERSCLNKFGNEYRKYMDRTPRWIGIPKLGKN